MSACLCPALRSYRLSARHSNSHALVNASFRATLDRQSSTVRSVILAFGAMGSPAIRASRTEAALTGQKMDQATLEAALLELRKEVTPAGTYHQHTHTTSPNNRPCPHPTAAQPNLVTCLPAGVAAKSKYRYRLELMSSFLFKFCLAVKVALHGPSVGLDTRLLSAAEAPAQR